MQVLVTTMAIMARLERPLLFSSVFSRLEPDVTVLDGGLLGEGVSAGKGSPGLSMYVLFCASRCCSSIIVEALGLMEPTMP